MVLQGRLQGGYDSDAHKAIHTSHRHGVGAKEKPRIQTSKAQQFMPASDSVATATATRQRRAAPAQDHQVTTGHAATFGRSHMTTCTRADTVGSGGPTSAEHRKTIQSGLHRPDKRTSRMGQKSASSHWQEKGRQETAPHSLHGDNATAAKY